MDKAAELEAALADHAHAMDEDAKPIHAVAANGAAGENN
jgi:hypothetical protein